MDDIARIGAIAELEDLENLLDELVEMTTAEEPEPTPKSPTQTTPKPVEPAKPAVQLPPKVEVQPKPTVQLPPKAEPAKSSIQLPPKVEPAKPAVQLPPKVEVQPKPAVQLPPKVEVRPKPTGEFAAQKSNFGNRESLPIKTQAREGPSAMAENENPSMVTKKTEAPKVFPASTTTFPTSKTTASKPMIVQDQISTPQKSSLPTQKIASSPTPVVIPNQPRASPLPANTGVRNSIISLDSKGLQILVDEEEDLPQSDITSPTTVMLDQKLIMLNSMKKKSNTTISSLTQQKNIAAQNQEFERANKIKTDLEGLSKELEKLRKAEDLVKKALNLERKMISLGVTKADSKIVNTETDFQRKKRELEELRTQAAQKEDYESALKYKQQIEVLEKEYLGKVQNLKQEGLNSLQVVSTREKKKKEEIPQDPALYTAVRGGKLTELKKLVEQENKNVNSQHPETGNTALHVSVLLGMDPITNYLLERKADINMKNRRGQTPLHLSVDKRNDPMTCKLIENGGDPHIQDNLGKSPFELAAKAPSYQMELKEFIILLQKKRKEESEKREKVVTTSKTGILVVEEAAPVEHVEFFLKGGEAKTLLVSERDTAQIVIDQIAQKLAVEDLKPMMELAQYIMGNETSVKSEELVLGLKDKWPNQKSQYCRFLVRLKRGSPSTAALKWKKILYGKKN